MFHSCSLDDKINRLSIIMINVQVSRNFLSKIIVSVHHNNIHTLAIDIYKVANGMSAETVNDIFKLRDETHHPRHNTQFLVDPVHSVFNCSESASYLGPKIWEQVPTEIKNKTLVGFKKEIRKWKPLNCPCRFCKTFLADLGFI